MVRIKFQKLTEDAQIPQKAHAGDAGYDLYASEQEVCIPKMKTAMVSTGLALEIPEGYEAQVRSRSGLAKKEGVFVLNSPGTIDSGYRGEVQVLLANFGDEDYTVNKGDRIAQIVFQKLSPVELSPARGLSSSGRGKGGFGSTGM